jgi:hypothetical protein
LAFIAALQTMKQVKYKLSSDALTGAISSGQFGIDADV